MPKKLGAGLEREESEDSEDSVSKQGGEMDSRCISLGERNID